MTENNIEDVEELQHNPVDVSEYKIESYSVAIPVVDVPESQGLENDVKTDYENARKTYYELVEKGKDALDNLLQVAASSEHPRAYEVAAQLIKTISDSNDKIVFLQEQMRKIQEQEQRIEQNERTLNGEETTGTTVNNNAIFVGSMKDFQQMVKKMKSGELTKESVKKKKKET
jgi:DNA-binding PadR family transcriptional regulator